MSEKTTRRVIDFFITVAAYFALDLAGAGLWALLIIPYGMWNYYDGMTRNELRCE